MLPDPDAQDVLCAVHGDAQNHICRLGLVLMVFLHLVVDGIQKHEEIHHLQRPVLPRRGLWHDLLADLAHQLRRDVHVVQTLDLLRDVPLAHPADVQPQNFLLHPVSVPTVLCR